MERTFRRPNILYLDGVVHADYEPMEKKFEEKLLEDAKTRASCMAIHYDKIPDKFIGLSTWTKTTNLHCWGCDSAFDEIPKFIPTSITENLEGQIEIGVKGVFCTFYCVSRYIHDMYGTDLTNSEGWRMQDRLAVLYGLFTGKTLSTIPLSPCKTTMERYGGDLTEEDYRNKLRRMDQECGTKDSRLGSIVPDRLRTRPAPSGQSVWEICTVNDWLQHFTPPEEHIGLANHDETSRPSLDETPSPPPVCEEAPTTANGLCPAMSSGRDSHERVTEDNLSDTSFDEWLYGQWQ